MNSAKVLIIVFAGLLLLCGGAFTMLFKGAKRVLVKGIRDPMTQMVHQSNLPEAQKKSLSNNLEYLADGLEEGEIGVQQVVNLNRQLAQDGFYQLLFVEIAEHHALTELELTEQEQAETRRTFERFQRGLVEETISMDTAERIASPLASTDEGGKPEVKQQVTKEQLRAFIDEMKSAVDQAGVPDEPYQVDLAGRLDRIFEDVLGKTPATRPATTNPVDTNVGDSATTGPA
jgi:hypothetical protein